MKKLTLAFAALAACAGGLAQAQTNVTVFGIVDVGLVMERGGSAGSLTKLTSGVASASRFGLRGTEDLGGGLSANFIIENGFNADTGAMTGGLLFGRQAFVGLRGGFGAVNLGRQYTPHYQVVAASDPFSAGTAGRFSNLMAASGVRMDNTIRYTSPSFAGFTLDLAQGFGEVGGNSSASRATGLSLNYAQGPLRVGLGHHKLNNATATDAAENTAVAGTYDFGAAKAHLAYGVNEGAGTTDTTDLLVGATLPLGAGKLLLSYIRKDDRAAANRDATQWALGYTYALSKRTDIYTAYARIRNRNGATFTVGNNTEPGSGDRAFNLGLRHSF